VTAPSPCKSFYGGLVRNLYNRGGVAKLVVCPDHIELRRPFGRVLIGYGGGVQFASVRQKLSPTRRYCLRIEGMGGPWFFATWKYERLVHSLTSLGWDVDGVR
jgi:hypothetical protein